MAMSVGRGGGEGEGRWVFRVGQRLEEQRCLGPCPVWTLGSSCESRLLRDLQRHASSAPGDIHLAEGEDGATHLLREETWSSSQLCPSGKEGAGEGKVMLDAGMLRA